METRKTECYAAIVSDSIFIPGYHRESVVPQSSFSRRVRIWEMTEHLGYPPHAPEGKNTSNSCNGRSKKSLKGEFSELPVEVPRDHNSSFEPQIVPIRREPL